MFFSINIDLKQINPTLDIVNVVIFSFSIYSLFSFCFCVVGVDSHCGPSLSYKLKILFLPKNYKGCNKSMVSIKG